MVALVCGAGQNITLQIFIAVPAVICHHFHFKVGIILGSYSRPIQTADCHFFAYNFDDSANKDTSCVLSPPTPFFVPINQVGHGISNTIVYQGRLYVVV